MLTQHKRSRGSEPQLDGSALEVRVSASCLLNNNVNCPDLRDVTQARRQALLRERKQLPIWSCRDALLAEVRANQVLVLVGETGSGKSTQLPQFLLSGDLLSGSTAVAVTQPRRVAAVSLARRVAEESGTQLVCVSMCVLLRVPTALR